MAETIATHFLPVFLFPVYDQTVDLQDIKQGMLEVDQRAVAGAEVVERELHAQVFQLSEPVDGLLRIFLCRPFGDLEHETTWIQPGLTQNAGYLLGQVGLLDLLRREVHAQAERRAKLRRVSLLPLLEQAAGLLQDP